MFSKIGYDSAMAKISGGFAACACRHNIWRWQCRFLMAAAFCITVSWQTTNMAEMKTLLSRGNNTEENPND